MTLIGAIVFKCQSAIQIFVNLPIVSNESWLSNISLILSLPFIFSPSLFFIIFLYN